MSDIAAVTEDRGAPLSLYFDLEEGQVADLEVVARAAIAWSAAIKELAFILDPALEIRVEIASGTPSSLSLNSIIRSVRDKLKRATDDPNTLRAIIIGLAIHFGIETVDTTYSLLVEKVFGKEEAARMSDEDIDRLAERLARAQEDRVAESFVQQVYREAERDPVIRGVGVTTSPGERPAVVVPRDQFAQRAGHALVREETVTRRTIPTTERVVLIKPVLVPGNRHWSLRTARGEFGFTIKDTEFVERVLSGTTAVPMVAGIEMTVDIETVEELRSGVWVPKERFVMRVVELHRPERQASLALPPREDDEPSDD